MKSIAFGLLALFTIPGGLLAQTYPSKPIRMVLTYSDCAAPA
jgi:hypothetical protein